MVDPSTRLRRIARVLTAPVRSHSMPTPVMAGLLLALTLGWTFFAYGQRTIIPFHTILWSGTPGLGVRSNIALNTRNGLDVQSHMVINEWAAWSSIWTTTHSNCVPGQCPIPEVNFTLRTVLAVFLGETPSLGYAINITKVTGIGSNVLVDIVITVPGATCVVLTAIGASSHIVDIPKTQASVMFRTETAVRDC